MRKLNVLLLALVVALWAWGCDSSSGSDDPGVDVVQDEDTSEPVDDTSEPVEDVVDPVEDVVDPVDDTVEPVDEFATLLAYLEGDNGDYLNTAAPKVIGAADVLAEGLDAWQIVDLRTGDKYGPDADGNWAMGANGTADYEDGHIEGAEMVAIADLVTYASENLDMGDKVLVVCWTGQLAGHATLALNLMGYDAYSLKFGMSSWHPVFDLWSPNTSSDYVDQFVTDADTGKNAAGDYPEIETGETTGQDILMARLGDLLANSPRLVAPADALSQLSDYYIVNYWGEADYLGMGHFADAHQYTPKESLMSSVDLATLPTDQPILVYCYSGQTGSQVAAYLTLLGYDAWDLKFGTNGLIYDNMTSHQWPGPADYAYVGAQPQVDEFATLTGYLEGDGGDYLNTDAPKVIGAGDVMAEGLDAWHIIDLRTGDKYGAAGDMTPNGTADFEDGHIEGATMVAIADLLTYAEENLTMDDKILVVCWTGQLAGHAVLALNLLGYDAYSLKFGMSSWSADFDLWSGNTSSDYAAQFVTDADTGKNAAGDYPVLDTGETTAMGILSARLEALVAGSPRLVAPADALSQLGDYYILNYWGEADYLAMGHFADAHQYTPKASLLTSAELATLPADEPILVYCYSGQTGSQVAAYLWLLGYDAWDLKFGTNGLIFDTMTSHTWPGPSDFTYVTSAK